MKHSMLISALFLFTVLGTAQEVTPFLENPPSISGVQQKAVIEQTVQKKIRAAEQVANIKKQQTVDSQKAKKEIQKILQTQQEIDYSTALSLAERFCGWRHSYSINPSTEVNTLFYSPKGDEVMLLVFHDAKLLRLDSCRLNARRWKEVEHAEYPRNMYEEFVHTRQQWVQKYTKQGYEVVYQRKL